MATLTEQFQKMANKYMSQHGRSTTVEMATWMVSNQLWLPQRADMIRQCATLLARALRQEYFIDKQGRKVRAKHAVTSHEDGQQTAFWDDIRSAGRQHMHMAFQQRREQILGECCQLKTDVDSYNDNNNPGEPIQMPFNFEEDLEELKFDQDAA